jgi:NADP-dependent 3-hydroxy acid dehydrogenase YdfG
MAQLDGKTAFITGGSSGIGKATVAALLEEGARVFAMGYTQEHIDALEQELGCDRLATFQGDVREEDTVRAAFAACVDAFGTVDVLINNAGVGIPTRDLSETDVSDYDRMMDVNVRGVFLCNREALKLMKPRGSGHIITVISMAGQRTNPVAPIYCASKFAARGLSMGLGDQVLGEGIRVTEVNPGPVDTRYWGERDVPREKMLDPQDVARAIVFAVTLPEHVCVREINMDSMDWLGK